MQIKWCSNCGRQISGNPKYCPHCFVSFSGTVKGTEEEYSAARQKVRQREWYSFIRLVKKLLFNTVVLVPFFLIAGIGWGLYQLNISLVWLYIIIPIAGAIAEIVISVYTIFSKPRYLSRIPEVVSYPLFYNEHIYKIVDRLTPYWVRCRSSYYKTIVFCLFLTYICIFTETARFHDKFYQAYSFLTNTEEYFWIIICATVATYAALVAPFVISIIFSAFSNKR